MSKRSNEMVSPHMVRVIRSVVNDLILKNDFETCVDAGTVAADKRIAKGFVITNPKRLREDVLTAVKAGQLPGWDVRVGRNGGIHRVVQKKKTVSKAAKIAKVAKASAPAPEPAATAAAEPAADTTATL